MSELDHLSLQRLENLAEQPECYRDLMKVLTTSDNIIDTFYKDYRQTAYGFSVIKCTEPTNYHEVARANNIRDHLPLTLVKQDLYTHNFNSVIQETFSMFFDPRLPDKGFHNAIMTVV